MSQVPPDPSARPEEPHGPHGPHGPHYPEAGDAGAVVIGRNEAEHLESSLRSAARQCARVVYVDSGSTDASVRIARGLRVEVLELDPTRPFSAARARNEGLERLLELDPEIAFVQFIDGDCELAPGWVARGLHALRGAADTAIVCGHLRERRPEASVYNGLLALEWRVPVGIVAACGGIHMARVAALRSAGGFDPRMTAGEEPELCLRLRRLGCAIRRIDAEMAVHDADMKRFGDWWTRTVRSGFASAAGFHRHGLAPERHNLRAVVSVALWAVLLPVVAVGCAFWTGGLSLVALAIYPLQAWRIRRGKEREGVPVELARPYGAFIVLGKFAEALGIGRYLVAVLLGRP